MATKKITFKLTTTGAISAYWLAVGADDLRLAQGVGAITLTVGKRYILIWHMIGTAGSSVAIVGKDSNGNEVVAIKQSGIPDGESSGAGARRFPV